MMVVSMTISTIKQKVPMEHDLQQKEPKTLTLTLENKQSLLSHERRKLTIQGTME
jgi:hypothetical protein